MPEACDLALLALPEASELRRLCTRCPDIEALRFREGECFIREGEEDRDVYLVLDGAFVVEKAPAEPGGRPAMLAGVSCEPGAPVFVGEMAYLGTGLRSASVRSSGSSHALRLRGEHVDAILEGFPGLTRALCRQFAERLRETSGALRELQGRFDLGARPRMASAGDCLFRAGEPAGELFQLVAGELELEGPSGSRTVTPEALPGGFLEPGPFLAGGPQACTVSVRTQAFLFAVPAARREAFLRCHPEVALALLAAFRPA